jgi:hypothetical protein
MNNEPTNYISDQIAEGPRTPAKFQRLAQCIAAGDALSLFPLLKYWPQSELELLSKEIEDAFDLTNDEWGKLAVSAENFLNPSRQKLLDSSRDDIHFMLYDIAGVLACYLKERD